MRPLLFSLTLPIMGNVRPLGQSHEREDNHEPILRRYPESLLFGLRYPGYHRQLGAGIVSNLAKRLVHLL